MSVYHCYIRIFANIWPKFLTPPPKRLKTGPSRNKKILYYNINQHFFEMDNLAVSKIFCNDIGKNFFEFK